MRGLLQHEHQLLEECFPRHVIEWLTSPDAAPAGGEGGGCAALQQRFGGRRPLDRRARLENMAALATRHDCVTVLFAVSAAHRQAQLSTADRRPGVMLW